MTEKILSEKSDGVGWLTFNNPERRNALSLEMWQRIDAVLADFDEDPSIRVAVVRGAGGKAFVSGADISQFEDQRKSAEQAEIYERVSRVGRQRLESFSKPLIAMIQGFCVGGGVSVAASADIRVASEDSQFAVPAARLGIGYPYESVTKLVALVGPSVTKQMLFTARRLNAQEALRVGLVNNVVAADRLEAEVRQLAQEIAENAPLTIRAVKYAVEQATRDPDARDMAGVEARVRACFDSADYADGRQAFMEKRKPVFTGH